MSYGHNRSGRRLARQLIMQLDPDEFEVLLNDGHLVALGGFSYVPDVVIVPATITSVFESDPQRFEEYADPLPFLAEIWSPSTGNYDVDKKIPAYRLRGDAEIWRLHPFERTLTLWRRQPNGSYQESHYEGGTVQLHALPWVTIDLDELFVGI
jgi:Uma2 family endonuclease